MKLNRLISVILSTLCLLAVLAVPLGLAGCETTDTAKVDTSITGSTTGTVALDLNDAYFKVKDAYAQFATANKGNINLMWALQTAMYANSAYVKTKDDINNLIATWTGVGGAGLANQIATIFGQTQGTTTQKMLMLAQAATNTGLKFLPKG